MNLQWLKTIRLYELNLIFDIISQFSPNDPGNIKVLEIGAGTGWQAQKMSEKGYKVTAIDIEDSNYRKHQEFPIQIYDGCHIPFPDRYFDIIYSSNVLEHIPTLKEFQSEIQRVLKDDGFAIHVLPSSTWRILTNFTHYLFVTKRIIKRISQIKSKGKTLIQSSFENNTKYSKFNRKKKLIDKLRKTILPYSHGERGSFITETYYFSHYYWDKIFTTTNWRIVRRIPNRLLYSGYMVLGPIINIRIRHILSYLVGSSAHIYILKKQVSK